MNSGFLLLRCYVEKAEGQWQAFCLDLCLASQADSQEEARDKLHAMIWEYVQDAVAGEDRAYASRLLSRPAPFRYWVKYYWIALLSKLGAIAESVLWTDIERYPGAISAHA